MKTIPARGQTSSTIFGFHRARFQSGGKLDELIRQGVSNYDNVFIDESHRFRTETNQTYEMLAQICRGKRVILVSPRR